MAASVIVSGEDSSEEGVGLVLCVCEECDMCWCGTGVVCVTCVGVGVRRGNTRYLKTLSEDELVDLSIER